MAERNGETDRSKKADTDIVRQLAKLLHDNDLTEIEMEDSDRRIVVKRQLTAAYAMPSAPPPQAAAAPAAAEPATELPAASHPGAVKSPMVGTVYLAGEPGAKPFVAAGQRVGEGDSGPNTGGMGAYSPAPVLTAELEARAMDSIVRPTAEAMAAAGMPFSGVLYAGLMLTADGPKLIEYNVRFGDPECEASMPLIDGDFAELLNAVATGRLGEIKAPRLIGKHAVTVIVAARGYPDSPASGGLIREIEAAEQVEGVTVFHAGTSVVEHGLVAKGGRVLAVTAVAETFANARARAYRAVDQIDFADGFHRRDIGWRELARENA
jgi:hypothetical protein